MFSRDMIARFRANGGKISRMLAGKERRIEALSVN